MLADLVILGAGQAGLQAAMSARQAGYQGRIRLVGDEPVAPYQRPPLSKAYLAEGGGPEGLLLRPETFLRDQGIAWTGGVAAVAIDRDRGRVMLADGSALPFDALVIATGSRNRALPVPGAGLEGVLMLRTVAEAAAIRDALARAAELVVIGAGYIGLEVAAAAAKRGLKPVIVEAQARPLMRAVSAVIGDHAAEHHRAAGARLILGARVARILGEQGRAVAVELVDGRRLPADLVVVGIGAVPNQDIAARAGLETGDGILVDPMLRTGDPRIHAIGDVACFANRFLPARMRLESVQNATDQGRHVGAALMGKAPGPYAALPWFWSDQGAMRLQMAGLARADDAVVLRGRVEDGAFSAFRYRDARLVAVESVNRPQDHVVARRILAAGAALDPRVAADPGADLRQLAQRLVAGVA